MMLADYLLTLLGAVQRSKGDSRHFQAERGFARTASAVLAPQRSGRLELEVAPRDGGDNSKSRRARAGQGRDRRRAEDSASIVPPNRSLALRCHISDSRRPAAGRAG